MISPWPRDWGDAGQVAHSPGLDAGVVDCEHVDAAVPVVPVGAEPLESGGTAGVHEVGPVEAVESADVEAAGPAETAEVAEDVCGANVPDVA